VSRVKEIMGMALGRLKEGGYSINADRFHLINSTLTPQGPVYNTMETYHFPRH
jgi:2'-5' RNA ligase